MLNLEEFYYQVVCETLPGDRHNAITLINDVVVINFDCLYDRDYVIRGKDQLLYLAHQIGPGKRFLFLSEDGAIVSLSGAIDIIKNVVNTFGLTVDTCALICRENITITNVNVIVHDAIDYWCRVLYPKIKDVPIPQGPFQKKFAVWFHRGTFFRLILAKHLINNYRADAFISYQEQGVVVDRNLVKYFEDELTWAQNYTPIVYDALFPNRVFNYELIVGPNRKPYQDYFIEIVAETNILDTNWITEKTVKNLYIGKPFIVMCGVGVLDKIKSKGFKTFSPWIDESYDTIENIHERLASIKREIDRIAKFSYKELSEINQEMQPIFAHNKKIYVNYINSR